MNSFLHPDEIRSLFSAAMSDMYRAEVPLYGDLIALVKDVNASVLKNNPTLRQRMDDAGELDRLDVERHGAIRLGTAAELNGIRRMFAVMGMYPVDYYDLSVAGLPVHSTAFRPTDMASLNRNPFRVFTSLIRLDLLDDKALAAEAEAILAERQIITDQAMALIDKAEAEGGLTSLDAQTFVAQSLETFRWHSKAIASADTYQRLHKVHGLIADVVCFKGPHINHLTPRTLDIDAVQAEMPRRGITPKAVVEGPPPLPLDILLRQTSFKALEEAIEFQGPNGVVDGRHTARFGEIEQRGAALRPKGRELYDQCLNAARQADGGYVHALSAAFADFPDETAEDVVYVRYRAIAERVIAPAKSISALLADGAMVAEPQVYEDFLPVSAAGIFRSNLGSDQESSFDKASNQDAFEAALGAPVQLSHDLYGQVESNSLKQALNDLGQDHLLT